MNELNLVISEYDKTARREMTIPVDFATYIPQNSFEVFYDEESEKVFIQAEFETTKSIVCRVLGQDKKVMIEAPFESQKPLLLELASCQTYTFQLMEKNFLSLRMLREKKLWFFKKTDLIGKIKQIDSIIVLQNGGTNASETVRTIGVADWALLNISPTEDESQYSAILLQNHRDNEGNLVKEKRTVVEVLLFIKASAQNNQIMAEILSLHSSEMFVYDKYHSLLLNPIPSELPEDYYRIKALIFNA